jgi:hypothetical protein
MDSINNSKFIDRDFGLFRLFKSHPEKIFIHFTKGAISIEGRNQVKR